MTRFVKVQIILSEATMNRIASAVHLRCIEDSESWLDEFESQLQLQKDIGFDVFHDIKNQIKSAMEIAA